jgi:hypothetical protein
MKKTPNEKTLTGEKIQYTNGNIMSIYCQSTKKGVRYYSYFRGRFQIISKLEIQQLAI